LRNPDLHKLVSKALSSDSPVEMDMVIYGKEERILHGRATALMDSEGKRAGALLVLNDVTRLRKLENIRRDFVANASHEIKTPITAIKGFVETLQDGAVKDPENADRFLDIVQKHIGRLEAIVEDLLSLSRVEEEGERGQIVLEEFPLREALMNTIQICQIKGSAKNIRIHLSCEEPIRVKMNPPLLEQAVTNLLDNAINYSDSGRDVHVEVQQTRDETLIHVRDQGCGIERHHLDRIFERFYRVDKARSRTLGGTGLGLAIVKHIIHSHGGYVSVESRPGRGSTFTLHLPRGFSRVLSPPASV
jgi:two-component system phosphate regulon sensor histidine kinase PhoR